MRRRALKRRYGRARQHPAYGNKRDYPKIELYYDKEYKGTTTWARTQREAKEQFIKKHPHLDPSKVVAYKGAR